MKTWILGAGALAAAFAIAGASSGDLAAQQLDDEMRPMAGQYQAEMTVLSIDIPDAPPDIAGMMTSMMNRKFKFCLTQADVDEGFRSVMNQSQQGDCSYSRFNATNGRIDAEMTCDAGGNPMTMVMQGTGSPTSSDVTMTMSGDMGMGPGTIKLRTQNRRLGDC
ncbi:DUF3617 domain-containing protein [uncultured Erythrobacter sp.]|uniref:DUF3617 domain-containing protein n=1 Tax=uncultured Erythrobacter sp. TaxID=263913 RepID=UPI0026309BCC|nr:DUF3617 domain-containing protein [uncultured Erythrobacter sp.]